MATRGRIGIQLSDGSVLSVYHHYDSYESWLGRILRTHFNSKDKASELIDGGDMSCCWTKHGPEYYSARGEDCPPRLDSTLAEFLDKDNNEEYAYVWKNNEWIACCMNQFNEKDPEVVTIPSGALLV